MPPPEYAQIHPAPDTRPRNPSPPAGHPSPHGTGSCCAWHSRKTSGTPPKPAPFFPRRNQQPPASPKAACSTAYSSPHPKPPAVPAGQSPFPDSPRPPPSSHRPPHPPQPTARPPRASNPGTPWPPPTPWPFSPAALKSYPYQKPSYLTFSANPAAHTAAPPVSVSPPSGAASPKGCS